MERRKTKIFAILILSVCALAVAVALIFLFTPKAEPLEPAYAEGKEYDPNFPVDLWAYNSSTIGDGGDKETDWSWGTIYAGYSQFPGCQIYFAEDGSNGSNVNIIHWAKPDENENLIHGTFQIVYTDTIETKDGQETVGEHYWIKAINYTNWEGNAFSTSDIADTPLCEEGRSTHDFEYDETKGEKWGTSFEYTDNGETQTYTSDIGHFAKCNSCGLIVEVPHRPGKGKVCLDCDDVPEENSYLFTIETDTIGPEDWAEDNTATINITADLRLFVGSTLNLTMQCPCLELVTESGTDSSELIYYSVTIDDSSEPITFTSGDDDQVIWTYTAYKESIESADDLWVEESDITITITLTIDTENESNSNLVGDFYCELVFKVDDGSEEV